MYRKIADKSERQIFLRQRILSWILGAKRPLTLQELQEAISIDPNDKYWDKSKIPTDTDGRRFLESRGALASFDDTDTTVRLTHHTVAQYLHKIVFVDGTSENFLLDICLTYLNFHDFETQVTLAPKERSVIKWDSPAQSPFYPIVQLLGISRGVYDFVLRLSSRSDRGNLPDVDYGEILKNFRRETPSVPYDGKYRLLGYVRRYWIWHASQVDDTNTQRWAILRRVVFEHHLPFEFRPWDSIQRPQNLPYLPVFIWALEATHKPLILLLRDLGILKHYLRSGETVQPISRLIGQGRTEMLSMLIDEDPTFTVKRTFMDEAILTGHASVLQIILSTAQKVQASTVKDSVKMFIALDARDGVAIGYGLQPLHIAAIDGDIRLLR